MKKRVSLYIGGLPIDLGTESPILFNYTVEELRNPTIVKNSYSQQLQLTGTPNNNRVFQSYFRLDSAPGAAGFNPSKRVPFVLYQDGGVVLESGYAKLDGIKRTGVNVTYSVTLFGGLGGFLYSLQYTNEKTRSLADMIYKDPDGNVLDLGFVINRAAVMQAWQNAYTDALKWSIVNFAPAYNGIPDKFDAARALVKAGKNGLERSAEDGKYTVRDGFAIVDLPGDCTEWEVKDFRSYLQRPVISVRGLLRAICDPQNNGGYTVELDPNFFKPANNHYYSTWLTLKMLTAIKIPVTTSGGTAGSTDGLMGLEHSYNLDLGEGEKVISVKARPSRLLYDTSTVSSSVLTFYWGSESHSLINQIVCNGVFLQAVGYDAAGNAVVGSRVVACTTTTNLGQGDTAAEFAARCNFSPVYDDGRGDELYGFLYKGVFRVTTFGECEWSIAALADLELRTTAPVAMVRVFCSKVQFTENGGEASWDTVWTNGTDISTGFPVLEAYFHTELEYTYTTAPDVRSNTEISQGMLLADTMSPAEFLLSYCKRYGLSISVDNARKVVRIEHRSTTYSNTDVIDLSGRVDRSREISIVPVPFSTEKMEFKEAGIGAGYADAYKSRYGLDYGAKRVNTGYEFNAEIKQILDGYKFKSAPEVKDRNLAFLTIRNPSRPALFLNSGLKYHLLAANNQETNELTVPAMPSAVSIDYWDETYKTYDEVPRLQLCDGDRKAKDGDGVLVFYQGRLQFPAGFYVSDDEPVMYLGNHDKPCWLLEASDTYAPGERILVPCFGRFRYRNSAHSQIAEMLEFGTPLELDIPGATIDANSDVYAVFWARYMRDRYAPSTKVLTCYIDTAGLAGFGPDALRRFYWIDGVLWTLNKICNYDPNSDGLTKCEFVQVQEIDNYNLSNF